MKNFIVPPTGLEPAHDDSKSSTTPNYVTGALFCGRQRNRPPPSFLHRGHVFKTCRRSNAAALPSFYILYP